MANYQIRDDVSGKTVTVSGDHAPTQQDAEEIFTKAGLRGSQNPAPAPHSSGIGSNIGGIVGGTIGNIVGVPAAAVTAGIVNPVTAGAGLAGAGGAIGETVDQLIHGQPLNGGDIAKAGGVQAAFGALPGGEEVKGASLAARLLAPFAKQGIKSTIARGAAGFGAGAGASEVEHFGDTGAALKQGAVSGVANAVSPVVAEAAKLPLKMVANTGESVAKAVGIKGSQLADLAATRLQKIFGPRVVETSENGASLNREYKGLFDKYGLDDPNITVVGDNLNNAASHTEQQLQTYLNNPEAALPANDVKASLNSIVDKNVGSQGHEGFTKEDINAFIEKELPPETFTPTPGQSPQQIEGGVVAGSTPPTSAMSSRNTDKVSLSSLLKFQREVGQKVDWDKKGNDPWKSLYFGVRDMIDKRTQEISNSSGDQTFNNLMDDHQKLIEMKENYDNMFKPGKTLPAEVTNQNLAKENILSKIAHNPEAQAAAVGAGTLLGSEALPEPFKSTARLLGAGLALQREAPRLAQNPNVANATMKAGNVAKKMVDSKKLETLLGQLGVRVP